MSKWPSGETNLGKKTSLVSWYWFHPDFSFRPQFWANSGLVAPIWGTLWITGQYLYSSSILGLEMVAICWFYLWFCGFLSTVRNTSHTARTGPDRTCYPVPIEPNNTWQNSISGYQGQHLIRSQSEMGPRLPMRQRSPKSWVPFGSKLFNHCDHKIYLFGVVKSPPVWALH